MGWSSALHCGATQLLDGRNRLDAMELVGDRFVGDDGKIDHPKISSVVDAAVDPYTFVISANIHRRHLTAEKKRELIAKLLKATPEKSDRQIAETVKASHHTVGAVRAEQESRGQIVHVETRTDTKGRAQPAKKKRRTEDDFRRDLQAKKAATIATSGRPKTPEPDTAKATTAAPARDDIGPNSQGEVERLRVRNAELENESRVQHSKIEDLKTALEKSATDRANRSTARLIRSRWLACPITDQLIILVGLLFDGLAPIEELVAALRLPENASLKRQSQLEGLQAMTGAVFGWMSVVREQVAEIKCALDEYAEPKASDGVGEIEASPAATVTSPPPVAPAPADDDPFAIPASLRRVAP